MKKASENLDFESAAKYRDQINSLKLILEKQKVVSSNMWIRILLVWQGDEKFIQVFL